MADRTLREVIASAMYYANPAYAVDVERAVVAFLSERSPSDAEVRDAETALREQSTVCGNYPPGSFTNSVRAGLVAARDTAWRDAE